MYKSALASVAVAMMLVVGGAVHAEELTLGQIVDLFISLEIIPADKADAARDAVEDLGATDTLTGTPGSVCNSVTLSNNMGPGSTDARTNGEVTKLQTYLALDSVLYPEGEVTGYYGVLTTAAVKRFQAQSGVVSSGTPDSTGYGMVGPRTRAALAANCASGMPTAMPSSNSESTSASTADESTETNYEVPAASEVDDADEATSDEDVVLPPPPPPPVMN